MQTSASLKLGLVFGLGAACIGGGWPVVTALGMQNSLTPYEVVILRVMLAGPLLVPFAFRGGNSLKAWLMAAFLTLLAGATFNLVVVHGFLYAPASHGGVIIPGTVMLVSMLAGHFLLHERLTVPKTVGSGAIILGLLALSLGAETAQNSFKDRWIGDSIFILAGLMWGTYTFLLRIWPVDPLVTVARISGISFIGIAIYHFAVQPEIHLFSMPSDMLIIQLVYQSILVSMVAVLLFSKSVTILGASKASLINSFSPGITIILAFIILKEIPSGLEKLGLGTILLGIMLAIRTREPAVQS